MLWLKLSLLHPISNMVDRDFREELKVLGNGFANSDVLTLLGVEGFT